MFTEKEREWIKQNSQVLDSIKSRKDIDIICQRVSNELSESFSRELRSSLMSTIKESLFKTIDDWKVYKVEDVDEACDLASDTGWRICSSKFSEERHKKAWDDLYYKGVNTFYFLIKGDDKWCYLRWMSENTARKYDMFWDKSGLSYTYDDIDDVVEAIPLKVLRDLPGITSFIRGYSDEDEDKPLETLYNKDGWRVSIPIVGKSQTYYFKKYYSRPVDRRDLRQVYIIDHGNERWEYFDWYTARRTTIVFGDKNFSEATQYEARKGKGYNELGAYEIVKDFPQGVIDCIPPLKEIVKEYRGYDDSLIDGDTLYYTPSTTKKELTSLQSKVKKVIISKDVEVLDHLVFSTWPLTEVTFEEGSKCKEIRDAFYRCKNLKSITIPKSVESLWCSFERSGLEDVKFEEGSHLKELKSSTFSYTKLDTITLPPSLEVISPYAFGAPEYTGHPKTIILTSNPEWENDYESSFNWLALTNPDMEIKILGKSYYLTHEPYLPALTEGNKESISRALKEDRK